MKVYDSIIDLIGKTPIIRLNKYSKNNDLKANLFAKLEILNPSGSIKDRTALGLIEDAESKGLLKIDSTIIEPTSGNTGVALSAIAAAKGYNSIMVMPETMSEERQKLIRAYGGKIVLTKGADGMAGAVKKAEELSKEIKDSFVPSQFDNSANPKAHYLSTGPEIWDDLDGKINILVAGIGTGGTISGTGKYLKEKNQNIKIIGIEPKTSPVITKGEAGKHKLQGLGANFIPKTLDANIYDEIILVSDEDAYKEAKNLSKDEGIFCGISSGAALYAAKKLAQLEENKDKNIVVILPDNGSRYLSTEDFID